MELRLTARRPTGGTCNGPLLALQGKTSSCHLHATPPRSWGRHVASPKSVLFFLLFSCFPLSSLLAGTTSTLSPGPLQSTSIVSQEGAFIHVGGSRFSPGRFLQLHEGSPGHAVALVARQGLACGSHRTITNRERVLKQLPRPGHKEKQETEELRLPGLVSVSAQQQPVGQASG